MRDIKTLIFKEARLEWKQKSMMGGMVLYVVSTVFVVYLTAKGLVSPNTWLGFYWVILLFASIQSSARSFMHENPARNLYYFSMASPVSIILSKMIYHTVFLSLTCLVHLFIYTLLTGYPVQNSLLFITVSLLGCWGFASTFTLISAISSRAGANTTLMAVLGFPVILPLIMVCTRISIQATSGLDVSVSVKFVLALVALNLLSSTLSVILFPYLWRE